MEYLFSQKERRKYQRHLINWPLNFQLKENHYLYPGLSINASETGLLIHTLQNMPIGIKLNIEVLFAKGFELSNVEGMAEIIWKDNLVWKNFKRYKYGLKFVQITNENYTKLQLLLRNKFNPERKALLSALDRLTENKNFPKSVLMKSNS